MSSSVVGVSELKKHLRRYLSRVHRGATLLLTDRGRVVARVEPASDANIMSDDGDAHWLATSERRGTIRRAVRRLPRNGLAGRPTTGADVVRALLDERRGGR
jgi:antitoxin (DNA-binding transcriptional repressor) of toxin-antitoxin stability system